MAYQYQSQSTYGLSSPKDVASCLVSPNRIFLAYKSGTTILYQTVTLNGKEVPPTFNTPIHVPNGLREETIIQSGSNTGYRRMYETRKAFKLSKSADNLDRAVILELFCDRDDATTIEYHIVKIINDATFEVEKAGNLSLGHVRTSGGNHAWNDSIIYTNNIVDLKKEPEYSTNPVLTTFVPFSLSEDKIFFYSLRFTSSSNYADGLVLSRYKLDFSGESPTIRWIDMEGSKTMYHTYTQYIPRLYSSKDGGYIEIQPVSKTIRKYDRNGDLVFSDITATTYFTKSFNSIEFEWSTGQYNYLNPKPISILRRVTNQTGFLPSVDFNLITSESDATVWTYDADKIIKVESLGGEYCMLYRQESPVHPVEAIVIFADESTGNAYPSPAGWKAVQNGLPADIVNMDQGPLIFCNFTNHIDEPMIDWLDENTSFHLIVENNGVTIKLIEHSNPELLKGHGIKEIDL